MGVVAILGGLDGRKKARGTGQPLLSLLRGQAMRATRWAEHLLIPCVPCQSSSFEHRPTRCPFFPFHREGTRWDQIWRNISRLERSGRPRPRRTPPSARWREGGTNL